MENHPFVLTNSSLTYYYKLSTDDVRELDRGNFGNFLRQALCMFLIKGINDHDHMYVGIRALQVFVAVAFISGILATAFQCPLPEPWVARNTSHCVAAGRIYLYNGIINAATDARLVVLSIAMVWRVQLPAKKKGVIVALFGLRIL